MRTQAKKGDTIRIIEMVGEPRYSGKIGTVEHVDDIGQIHGTWGGCAEKAINTIAKLELKIRRLSRAMYKAIANWAYVGKYFYDDDFTQWEKVECKCREKAKVFE